MVAEIAHRWATEQLVPTDVRLNGLPHILFTLVSQPQSHGANSRLDHLERHSSVAIKRKSRDSPGPFYKQSVPNSYFDMLSALSVFSALSIFTLMT